MTGCGKQLELAAAALRARFDAAGLQSEFTPLYGNTPFNNWRVVAIAPL